MAGAWVARILVVVAVLLALGAGGCGDDGGSKTSQEARALAQYSAYLEQNAGTLVDWLRQANEKIEAGHLASAQSRLASARVPYGHLEPMVLAFDALALRMNAGRGDLPKSEWRGFHRLEEIFWADKSPAGVTPLARQLLADAEQLRHRVGTLQLQPAAIARRLNQTLASVSASEVAGKEDPRSHIDLVDAAANVEGVEAGFDAVRPLLIAEDRDLAREIEAGFKEVYVALSDFGFAAREDDQPRPSSPGTSFVLYVERSAAEFRRLGEHIDALARPLSQALSRLPDKQ